VVLVLAQAALLLADAGCVQLASAAASLATDCDAAASAKANFKGLPAATPPFVRVLLRLARSRVATLGGPAGAAASWSEAEGAALVAVDPPDVVAANVAAALSAAHPSSGQPPSAALDAVLRALDTATNHDLTASIPVSAYLLACRLLASPAAARPVADWFSVAAAGCRVHNSASLFLQLGASCLRAERLADCEDALVEANLLDNRNAGVWAHLALLCLAYGTKRLAEAEAALFQALRLGLDQAPLLRELATGFMSCDRLLTSEDLIRRALACDPAPNPHHRKLLGDVLAGQQQAAAAVDEYKKVLELAREEGDVQVATAAAERSVALLATLGRAEEAAAVKDILAQLRGGGASAGQPTMV
jgi:tetratricopeptide (TPR) repeat protein